MDISTILSDDLKNLRKIFVQNSFDIRLVGGAVRDLLSNVNPTDIDLCTDANPIQQIELYQNNHIQYIETGLSHGTITVVPNHIPYEITSLRTDADCNGRHATVSYTKDWVGDQNRRDFTINSMMLSFDGELFDMFNGKKDLANGVVKFVGNPDDRIKEDYLRIMRWFRFYGRYGNKHSNNEITLNAIRKNSDGLKQISAERIWKEFKQILSHNSVLDVITLLRVTEVIKYLILDTQILSDVAPDQLQNVLYRTSNPITRFLAIFFVSSSNVNKFANHFKWSSEETKLAQFLSNFNYDSNWDHCKLLAFNNPHEYVKELAILHSRDEFLTEVFNSWEIPKFPINGNDIIEKFNINGEEVGKKIKMAKHYWANNGYKLTKTELLSYLVRS